MKNAKPEVLTQAQERLDKSIAKHEEWLKNFYSKVDGDPEVRTNMIGIKERTYQLRKAFDAFSEQEKAWLFSSKKRYESLKEAREGEELFEESLNQEYFGVRNSEDTTRENVFKFISTIEEMNWSLIQPLSKMLKKKSLSEKGEKTWHDSNGIEMEAKVNYFRPSGEFVVSICSRIDERKDFKFLKDTEALPSQFGCTRLNIKDGSIEKGMENREEIASPEVFQAFLTETFFQTHDLKDKCLSYFISHGPKKTIAMKD